MAESNIAKLKSQLKELTLEGELLRICLASELGMTIGPNIIEELKNINQISFKGLYESWYSLAQRVVKQLIPDRLSDFVKCYRDEKRKQIDYLTYGISDYMIGLQNSLGDRVIVDGKAAFPKFQQQLSILKSAHRRFDSSLFDIIEIVQADLFDNELEAAKEFLRKGFGRGAGAMAGVVLERHLSNVANKHSLKPRKSTPTINDLNQLLKDNDVIDTATWRSVQL